MKEPYKITKALLKPVNTAAIILLGIYTIVWGFWLANPFWDAFSRAPLYSELENAFAFASVNSEAVWGLIAISSGCVICYGAYKPSYRALITGASVAFVHWFVISMFYFWGDWQNTGGITAVTFAIYAAFIYLNIKVNHKQGNLAIEECVK